MNSSNIELAVTSPFSESWGQYQLHPEDLPWRKASEGRLCGKWIRALWGNELYQERRSSSTGRSDDMVTMLSLTLPLALDITKFFELFKLSCMHARFIHPILAVTIETNVLQIPLMPCLVYEEVHTFEQVQSWSDTVMFIHRCETDEERAQSREERLEFMRNKIGLRPLPLTQHVKEWHWVLFGRAEDQSHVALFVYSAHAVSDAHSELILMKEQLEYVTSALEAPFPLPEAHSLHPATLAWGTEVTRLTPSLLELVGVPLDSFSDETALRRVRRVLAHPFLRLDLGRPKDGSNLTDTLHDRIQFTAEETAAIHKAARAHGWSVTHIVDAARHMAYMELRRSYLESWHWNPIPEKLHVNFLVPANARCLISESYKHLQQTFVGNATEGFTTVLPLMDPYFVSAQDELMTSEKPLHELSQVRTLAYVTQKLAEQYYEEKPLGMERIVSETPTFVMAGVFSPLYPFDNLAPEGFSSVGAIDTLLPCNFHMPSYTEPITVDDWGVGVIMSRHLSSLQFSMHMWTFRQQLNLSVVHTPHISKARTELFLDTIHRTLKLFLMAFEQHGKPIDIPSSPPTPFVSRTLFQRAISWCQSWFTN